MRTHFAANISENVNNLKVHIVKAEASMMIDDVSSMLKSYANVQAENGALQGEYLKRQNNHEDMIATLKQLNIMIKQASNLRQGAPSQQVI